MITNYEEDELLVFELDEELVLDELVLEEVSLVVTLELLDEPLLFQLNGSTNMSKQDDRRIALVNNNGIRRLKCFI